MELNVEVLRDLMIDRSSHPRGLSYLHAASGLVRVKDRFYVVADDEQHLAVFDGSAQSPGKLVRVFDGDLPASIKERKAVKLL